MQQCRKAVSENYDIAAELLTAMSNARRLELLCILLAGEKTVGNLAEQVGLSQSAVSQHLSKLRKRKLVTTRRDAQQLYYSVISPAVEVIMEALGIIFDESTDTTKAT